MRLLDIGAYIRDTALRMLPHRAPTGLVRIGAPDRDSPVLLTGNFTLTVRRLRDTLRGHDAWLLVANSDGINVWCAAGGGHLTHHDVISVVRTSGIGEKVDHRRLVLPQLCATGVERSLVTEATGFETRWGPARLEDLPAFLARGARVTKRERFMRFPLWERLEMAAMWAVTMLVIALPVLVFVADWTTAVVSDATLALMVGGLFAFLPLLHIRTRFRYVTFAAFAGMATLVGAGALFFLGAWSSGHLLALAVTCCVAMAILAVDLGGTTPWYASYINSMHNAPQIELVDDRCTGATDCVQACPRDVLKMNGARRKVEISKPDQCIQCGACIVQCPEDALRFRYADGRVVEAPTIRTTRVNMLGRRAIQVRR
jgi:NAD-dependent dihydropyrimidine dehydrogenase PreA subunit